MLDMEIRKSQFALDRPMTIDDDQLPFAEICRTVANDGNFLSSEHTARHCRELWTSRLFLTESPHTERWAGDEKAILDTCDRLWRENLKRYQPPPWPPEKIKALDRVLARAKREFNVP